MREVWLDRECGLARYLGGVAVPPLRRNLERREDDTLETLQRRMQEYHEKSEPLVSFYEGRGILRRIAAQGMPDSVFAEVVAALEESR